MYKLFFLLWGRDVTLTCRFIYKCTLNTPTNQSNPKKYKFIKGIIQYGISDYFNVEIFASRNFREFREIKCQQKKTFWLIREIKFPRKKRIFWQIRKQKKFHCLLHVRKYSDVRIWAFSFFFAFHKEKQACSRLIKREKTKIFDYSSASVCFFSLIGRELIYLFLTSISCLICGCAWLTNILHIRLSAQVLKKVLSNIKQMNDDWRFFFD